MSDINYKCPHCGQNMAADESLQGLLVKCPGCENQLKLPVGFDNEPQAENYPRPRDGAPAISLGFGAAPPQSVRGLVLALCFTGTALVVVTWLWLHTPKTASGRQVDSTAGVTTEASNRVAQSARKSADQQTRWKASNTTPGATDSTGPSAVSTTAEDDPSGRPLTGPNGDAAKAEDPASEVTGGKGHDHADSDMQGESPSVADTGPPVSDAVPTGTVPDGGAGNEVKNEEPAPAASLQSGQAGGKPSPETTPKDKQRTQSETLAGTRGAMRTWTDRSGKNKAIAKFVSLDQATQKVILQLEDGTNRSLPLNTLSIEDRHSVLMEILQDIDKAAAKRAIGNNMAYFIWKDDSLKSKTDQKRDEAAKNSAVPFRFFALKEPEAGYVPILAVGPRGAQHITKMSRGFMNVAATESVDLPGSKEKSVVERVNQQLKVSGTFEAHLLVLGRGVGQIRLYSKVNGKPCIESSNSIPVSP